MDRVAAIALGDAAIAAVALLMAAYEAWLWRRRRRPEHLWIAAASLAAAAYATLMVVHYDVDPEGSVLLSKLELVCVIVVGHLAPFAVMHLVGRPDRRLRLALVGSLVLWLGLAPTRWVIPDEVVLRQMLLLDHPFPRRAETAVALVAELYGVALVVGSAAWLWRHRAGRERDAWYFVVGIVLWLVPASADALIGLSGGPIPLHLFEYGFVAFALTLCVGDARRYMSMLDASERDFRQLIDRSPDAVAVLHDGEVVYANRALAVTLGRDGPESLVGARLEEVVHAEDRAALGALAASPGDGEPVELRFRPAGGPTVRLELVALSTEFDDRPATVVMARDVSARVELTARMVEMDRMVAVGTLAAGVGHEINNPLSYVLLNLHEARNLVDDRARADGDETMARVAECVEASIDGSERIRETVRALSFLSRGQQTRKLCSLPQVIESAVAITASELRHRGRTVLDLEPGLTVWANETRLGQVFVNLLTNAAHAIPPGDVARHRVTVRAWRQDLRIEVEVEDSGEGIEADALGRIFEPFFTTKPSGQGTGLGLGICRSTVREMGGDLTVDSRPGEGTVVRMRLPFAKGRPRTDDARDTVPPPRRGRILVVDDEPQLLRTLERALRRDADVVAVGSTREAIDLLAAGERFDLILSDLMMPNDTGMDLHAAMSAQSPDLARRIVFMTGGLFTTEAREFRDRIDNEILQKPLDLSEVRRHLRRALEAG